MARPNLPSVEDIISGKYPLSKVFQLPLPWQKILEEELQDVARNLMGSANVPETPIEMALENPKYRWMDARHLHYLGDQIADAVYRSKELGESAGCVIATPPRHAKSHTCSVWTPFWHLARYPDDNVLLIASEHTAAARWGSRVRRLVELHGETYNMKLNPKKVAGDDWELTTGGGMICVGFGGTVSGKPAKLLIGDDLVKDDAQARSEVQREQMWDWWEGTAVQRIEPDTTAILIGTRYHEDDILGRILRASANGTGHPFKLISLPAKAKDGDPLGRGIGEGLWTDHKTSSGLEWGQSYYDKREAAVSPYVWSSVYQQEPTTDGGNMVDPKWWKYYKPSELPRAFDQSCQSWDISLDAEKKTDSQHAGIVQSRLGALIYIRAVFAAHCDINRVISTMRSWNFVYPHARTKLIERATAGVALAQSLRHEIPGIIAWPPKGRQKGSKEAELDATIPSIRAGQVLLPLNPDSTIPAEVQQFTDQMRQFPRGQYDDLVDAFSQGTNYLLPGLRAKSRDQDNAFDQSQVPDDELTPTERHTRLLHAMIQKLGKPQQDALRRHQQLEERSVLPFNQGFRTGSSGYRGRRGSGMW